MGRVEGKTALVTGAARGQGRSHALRLAEEGAQIVAVDNCSSLDTVAYPGATTQDLAETVRLVTAAGGRILARQADVCDTVALESVVDEAVAKFGGIDIVCANAGIISYGRSWELPDRVWQEMLDVNLTGVFKTARAVIPAMLKGGSGGSIVITSSTAGLAGLGNAAHYSAAKHGVTGLMRTLAVELAQHHIRVNTVNPSVVYTPMIDNEATRSMFVPGNVPLSDEEFRQRLQLLHAMPIPWLESADVSNAVLFLASDESRHITGVQLPVDAGGTMPFRYPNT